MPSAARQRQGFRPQTWLGPSVHQIFFSDLLVMVAGGVLLGGLFIGSVLLRVMGFGAAPAGK